MSRENPTLQDLFVSSKADTKIPELKRAVAEHSKMIKWDTLEDVLADKVLEMLDVPLLGVLLSGWKKYREVKELANSDAHSKKQKVSLAQHTLTSEHHPYLEIRLKGVPVETLNFTVIAKLVLDGFLLTIQDRRITAVQTGSVRGQGSLALESTVILERDFGSIELPGTIKLGEGIPVQ
jgi:hypothetical protein